MWKMNQLMRLGAFFGKRHPKVQIKVKWCNLIWQDVIPLYISDICTLTETSPLTKIGKK